MKRTLLISALLLTSGCTNMSNTEQGAATGGILGAVGGTIVGAALHRPVAGALVGGAVGAATGAAVGNAEDRREDRAIRQAAAAQAVAARSMLSLEDVVHMTQSHIPPETIINQIRQTGSMYNLTADQIIWLSQQGVSQSVITEMQTRQQVAPVIYTRPAPVVIYERPAPVIYGGYYRRW
ncbi:MAG TPA: glycine zipper domain-containing protein [Gemmataceae bacterium]|nr:glycine zipper domain-containing protein [Gemmataceae bacterium]